MSNKKHSEESLYNLMVDIVTYLSENDMFYDTSIYVNKKHYSSNKNKDSTELKIGSVSVYQSDCEDPSKQIEYCNKDTLTMTFEGPLYEELNYGNAHDKLSAIFKKYGLYFEMGYAWSLTAYDL